MKIWQWCKRCFGIKTVAELVKEELAETEREIFSTTRSIMTNQARLQFLRSRFILLKKGKI